jgi:cytochrome d ubiquinol oxidase subunit II
MLVCAKDDAQRTMMINSLGRKWEFTFTTLVTFGGAFFASFPLFYSTSFGGAYWLWMIILFSFIIQAISYEYRRKEGNLYGTRFYDTLLLINGIIGPILLGVAVAMMFFGADFTVTKTNLLNVSAPTISVWGQQHGIEAILCWKNLLFGIMVFFLARTLASLYFINNIDDAGVQESQRKHLLWNGAIFVVLFLATAAVILTAQGVECNDESGAQWVAYKYLKNFLSLWWCLVIFLIGVVAVLYGIGKTLLVKSYTNGIWFAGAGTVLVVLTLLWVVGYNDTAYYPSLVDVNSSLTIRNSSSSQFTLTVMSFVSILVPFVLAYIVYAWHSMDKVKITHEEMEETDEEEKY